MSNTYMGGVGAPRSSGRRDNNNSRRQSWIGLTYQITVISTDYEYRYSLNEHDTSSTYRASITTVGTSSSFQNSMNYVARKILQHHVQLKMKQVVIKNNLPRHAYFKCNWPSYMEPLQSPKWTEFHPFAYAGRIPFSPTVLQTFTLAEENIFVPWAIPETPGAFRFQYLRGQCTEWYWKATVSKGLFLSALLTAESAVLFDPIYRRPDLQT